MSNLAHGDPNSTPLPDGMPRRFDYVAALKDRRAATGIRLSNALLVSGAILALGYYLLFRIQISELISVWSKNPNFSDGFLIPPIALVFVFVRREKLFNTPPKPSWTGLVILCISVIGQIIFSIYGQLQFSELSMIAVILGLLLWTLGWEHMRILWLPVIYLIFMIPPPGTLYVKITGPLQVLSAALGVSMLNVFGIHAVRTATQINMQVGTNWQSINVAQACSGIRLLTTFFALAILLGYTTDRPMWQKITLAVCALPVAIISNSLRVALSGVMFVTLGPEWARGSTHASLGLLMLIPAGLMQIGIAKLIDIVGHNLFVSESGPPDSATPGSTRTVAQ